VDHDMLDPRTGFAATPGGSVGNRFEGAWGSHEPFKVGTEAQGMHLRLDEREPGNLKAKELMVRKENMDWSKERLGHAAPQLRMIV